MTTPGGLDAFLWAEREQESGDNYRSVNPGSGALGAYQILPSHLRDDWGPETFGHAVSASEFLGSPPEQDAMARRILGGYYDRYGPRGAASAWYSGDPSLSESTRPQPGGPSIKGYVDDVIALMARAPGGGDNSSSGGTSPADDTSGSTVQTAGLQQAGYDAVINLTPWGIPLNPFKLPGWLAGKLSSGLGSLAGSAGTAMWDSMGPMVLAIIGVTTAAALLVLGLYVTVKPTIDTQISQASSLASIAK